MKKHLIIMALIAGALFVLPEAKAQFKIHDDGHISLGSLAKDYGVQVDTLCTTAFRTKKTTAFSWSTVVNSNNNLQKHWVVANGNPVAHTFFVYGEGAVYHAMNYRQSDARFQEETGEISNASNAIGQITGLLYTPAQGDDKSEGQKQRRVGVSAQEVEKAIPEAVSADETGTMYVDYEALTVFLIEALKEQKSRIDELETILKDKR